MSGTGPVYLQFGGSIAERPTLVALAKALSESGAYRQSSDRKPSDRSAWGEQIVRQSEGGKPVEAFHPGMPEKVRTFLWTTLANLGLPFRLYYSDDPDALGNWIVFNGEKTEMASGTRVEGPLIDAGTVFDALKEDNSLEGLELWRRTRVLTHRIPSIAVAPDLLVEKIPVSALFESAPSPTRRLRP